MDRFSIKVISREIRWDSPNPLTLSQTQRSRAQQSLQTSTPDKSLVQRFATQTSTRYTDQHTRLRTGAQNSIQELHSVTTPALQTSNPPSDHTDIPTAHTQIRPPDQHLEDGTKHQMSIPLPGLCTRSMSCTWKKASLTVIKSRTV